MTGVGLSRDSSQEGVRHSIAHHCPVKTSNAVVLPTVRRSFEQSAPHRRSRAPPYHTDGARLRRHPQAGASAANHLVVASVCSRSPAGRWNAQQQDAAPARAISLGERGRACVGCAWGGNTASEASEGVGA